MTRAVRDVIVVGAGPAGAATALLLAEQGIDVLVLDRGARPPPAVGGEYVSPEAGRVLDRLGVLKAVEVGGAVALTGLRITAPDGTRIEGRYRAIGAHRPYLEHAIGVSRTILAGALVERLRSLPVELREGVRVDDVLVEAGHVVGVSGADAGGVTRGFRARVVVAADGRDSVVTERLGCRRPHRIRRLALVTSVAGVVEGAGPDEVFVDPPDYAVLSPRASDRANLALVVPAAHAVPWSARLEDFFAARVRQLPHLAHRLEGAERVAPLQSLGPFAYTVHPPAVGGVLFVGAAAGFDDPMAGQGLFTALRSAELASLTIARSLREGDVSAAALADYERACRAAFADKRRLTRTLQLVIQHRWLATAVARWLVGRPDMADAVLGAVGDYVSPRALLRLALARR